MTFRLTPLATAISAAPGETVHARVEIHNDGSTPSTFTVSVVGLDSAGPTGQSSVRVSIDAGASATVDVPIAVPPSIGIGQHAAAFEAASNRANDRAVLSPFTLSIASVERVELVPVPPTIRAHRRARFHVDVTNREPHPVDVTLIGEAPDVDVEFTPSTVRLQPGQRVIARGKLRGPRHWSGEPTQHNVLITARGRSSQSTITAPYVQRPVFAHRFRAVLAGLTVIGLWLGAIGGVAFWLSTRNDGDDATGAQIIGIDIDGDGIPDRFEDAQGHPVTAKDTDGDGIPDAFFDADGNLIPGTDTNGDGIPDTLVTPEGRAITAVDTDGDGVPDTLSDGSVDLTDQGVAAPVPVPPTILRGTVTIDGDPRAVAVTLTPIAVGDQPSATSTPLAIRGTSPELPTGKIWPVRHGAISGISSTVRRTVTVTPTSPTNPRVDGVYLFTDVEVGQTYEISFALAGYDTQSFVVTPPADGQPVDLDVEMRPARGAISGSVVGPTGSKNAAITITDGTLEFKTTADSTTGAWSIDGVSTPGVYTITAELRGYGTAVRQVELGPGDRQSGVTLEMRAGVGTITGRVVDTAGEPLGGVTITATDGETTITSTTLTEGNVGFFSLPQITIPGTYTVRASLDGYITQTRRIVLTGNATGVDFTMTSETVTLRGSVTTSGGVGIANAGLIISTGDLSFRAATSAGRNPGQFSIDRLPPGTYAITAEHYEYESATQFVTLVAGVTPPPLHIVLEEASGPPPIGTGTLIVEVINSDPNIAPRGIAGAKVQISRNRSAEPPPPPETTVTSSVRFDNLTIGTYTILVTHPEYNDSQPITATIGMTEQTVQVFLQRLGSASGEIVDAVTGQPLLGSIALTLSRVNPVNGALTPVVPPIVEPTTGKWETATNALRTGIYEITVEQDSLPAGYIARNNQILDTDPALQGRPMRFIVPEVADAEVKPVILPALKIDRLPTITGHVLEPIFDGDGTPDFDWLDATFDVTATCNGTSVTATLSSTGGDAGLDDTFRISRQELGKAFDTLAELPGTCQLEVASAGRVSTPITLTNITASSGATSTTPSISTDRLLATALAPTPPVIEGDLFWIDVGTDPDEELPLSGTVTTGAVITRFNHAEGPVGTNPEPTYTTGVLTGEIEDGQWSIEGHLFRPTTYTFAAPSFGSGVVPVNVTESGVSFPSGPPSSAVITSTGGAAPFHVQLTDAQPGTLEARVKVNSNTPSPYPASAIATTSPSGASPAMVVDGEDPGLFLVADAEPGTWTVAFGTPSNHRRVSPSATNSVTTRLAPGGFADPAVNAEFTELGTIRVSFVDKTADPATAISTDASFELYARDADGNTTGPAITGLDIDDSTDGTYVISRVPVVDDPETWTGYLLLVTLPGHDLTRALIDGGAEPVNASRLAFDIRAGDEVTRTVAVAPFRSIQGSAIGWLTTARAAGDSEALQVSLDPADAATRAIMTVQPVNADGSQRSSTDPPLQLVSDASGNFTLTGAPGYYRISISDAEYQQLSAADTPVNPGGPLPPGVFHLGDTSNTTLATPFALQIRQGRLNVRAVAQLTDGLDVVDAEYNVYRGLASCTGDATTGVTVGTGASVQLDPGSYCVAVNRFDAAGKKLAFPAIVVLTIPRDSDAARSVTSVVAPLPAIRPSLTGRLVGRNTLTPPGEVDLVASPAPELRLEFDAPQIQVNGAGQDNLADPRKTATAAKTALVWTYEFEDVAYGQNTITAPTISGYTLDGDASRVVTVTSEFGPTEVPDFVYRQQVTNLAFTLGNGRFPSLDPQLPDNGTTANVRLVVRGSDPEIVYTTTSFNASTNTLTVQNVAPDARGFTLSFDDALHKPVSHNFDMPAITGASTPTISLASVIEADRVRVAGTAQLRTGPDTDDLIAFDVGSRLTVSNPSHTSILEPAPADPDDDPSSPGTSISGANYAIDVPAGTYTLSATRTGYRSSTTSVPLTALGTIVTRNVQIEKLATAQVQATMAGASVSVPAGVTYQLRDSNSVLYPPRSAAQPTTFDVPAGTYEAVATLANYGTHASTSTTTLLIGQGSTTPVNVPITLPRIARFTVLGPSEASVTLGARTIEHAAGAGNPFVFSDRAPEGQAIASSGTLNGTVSADGYRTQTISMPGTGATSGFLNTQVTLSANVTVTGTINAPAAAVSDEVIWAESGGTRVYGSINSSGTYSISGLTNNADGGNRTWTVHYDRFGVGTGQMTGSHTVGATSHTPPASTAITVSGSTITVTFNVSPAIASAGATVALLNGTTAVATATTPVDDPDTEGVNEATGVVTFQISESTAATIGAWRVEHTNYRTRSSAVTFTERTNRTINVALLAPITGTVVTGPSDTAVAGAAVRICASTFTSAPCSEAQSVDHTTSAATTGGFSFTAELAVTQQTDFRVWAISGAANGNRILRVQASGAAAWVGNGGSSQISIS